MPPKQKLKACPFCGGKAQLIINGIQRIDRSWLGYIVRCSVCYCGTSVAYKSKAITAWNTRHFPEEEVKKLLWDLVAYGQIRYKYLQVKVEEALTQLRQIMGGKE